MTPPPVRMMREDRRSRSLTVSAAHADDDHAVDDAERGILRVNDVDYGTFAPPLTLITSPTTKLDSGEARKT